MSEVKNGVVEYFRKAGRSFNSSKKFDRQEQGAGELGPLGGFMILNVNQGKKRRLRYDSILLSRIGR